ncbi:DNA-binding NarL/FixJ family response regulator [Clostridium tetanomorphum]|uniref:Stage 0 sporulation protein A homolog n=1 Tax=Clostridium tetanomorphum TaxID=1553 RepID=A0A923J3C7_CLOTT|nr:response regulator [Clostridium tetanomorphum]KAJ50057.1 CheY-like protein [Clostridium tetanomorphum DSM 665]MBC2399970.1 response regulator [Clostridium tetanomorphum]MBP1865830.1 DNA-binding NarL/FixJ family response regulator [Clostridium tetanomorphum]NRS85279.1 DNA-binding NarL/FixJ family response regulator [Clostridium tetanomorphum]NRZ98456.1 DNA-binding NarL/FixJ family response regulator [Clostridium tetanomorphum]
MKKLRIVIVDDSPFSISILKDILEENGHEVVGSAGTLQETIEVVRDSKPDLVTMDMTIPGTDGLECTRAIHLIDNNIKVVVVSSMMDEEIVKKAKKNNVAGYVQKPVEPEELITTIEGIMFDKELFDNLEKIYFTVFEEAFSNNLNRLTKTIPSFENKTKSDKIEVSNGVSVVIGIIGKYSGRMIMDLSYESAKSMAKVVLKRECKDMDECLAMVGELANIIAGNACSMINRKNKVFGLRVAPPTIFHGNSLKISRTSLETTSVMAKTVFGDIHLNVGFKRGEEEWM